jgi:membrane-bound lytic murein transglycosylase D
MKTNLRCVVLPSFLWLLVGPPVLAQTANTSLDPFAGIHSRLAVAANNSLDALKSATWATDSEIALQAQDLSQEHSATVPKISLDRVGAAQARLLKLRVDAARIFAEEGVPLELLVVAEVESGFNPLALSSKGARGPWQLMPATAERFGLRVDGQTDDRILPERSTRAAARYLRVLYEQFGDWLLALAAYNAGEGRVAKAIGRGGTRNFWQLAQQRLLPEVTRHYVPAVMMPESLR